VRVEDAPRDSVRIFNADELTRLACPRRCTSGYLLRAARAAESEFSNSFLEELVFGIELSGRLRRPLGVQYELSLKAILALASDAGTVTCTTNDFGYEVLFERQVQALAQAGDVVFRFTTSEGSENVRRGLTMAKERGTVTVAMTGAAGLLGGEADYVLTVPSDVTAHIQEVHLILLHIWCTYTDEELGKAI
jgi:D-sedoheptulose 7-phosphate isomerase